MWVLSAHMPELVDEIGRWCNRPHCFVSRNHLSHSFFLPGIGSYWWHNWLGHEYWLVLPVGAFCRWTMLCPMVEDDFLPNSHVCCWRHTDSFGKFGTGVLGGTEASVPGTPRCLGSLGSFMCSSFTDLSNTSPTCSGCGNTAAKRACSRRKLTEASRYVRPRRIWVKSSRALSVKPREENSC